MPSGVAPCPVFSTLQLRNVLLLPGVVLAFFSVWSEVCVRPQFFSKRGRDDLIPQVSE